VKSVLVSLEITFPSCPKAAQITRILLGGRDLQLANFHTVTTRGGDVLGVLGCRDLQLATCHTGTTRSGDVLGVLGCRDL